MSRIDPETAALIVEETWLDDVLVTAERSPGPAGVSVVNLLDGATTLALDTAEPGTVVSLALTNEPDHRLQRLVRTVLDLGPADDLLRWLAEESPRRPRSLHGAAE